MQCVFILVPPTLVVQFNYAEGGHNITWVEYWVDFGKDFTEWNGGYGAILGKEVIIVGLGTSTGMWNKFFVCVIEFWQRNYYALNNKLRDIFGCQI